MRNKILAVLLSVIIVITFTSNTPITAEKRNSSLEVNNITADNAMEYIDISNVEVKQDAVKEIKYNDMDRKNIQPEIDYSGSISNNSRNIATLENTNPNYAYVVSDDNVYQGEISSNGEMRWYAFILNEKSKVTILAEMANTLDSDLYMFSLNTETSQLDLIGGSATAGIGTTEYYTSVMNAGTYFFAMSGYEGTGAFAFAYYQSSLDVANELNDTSAASTIAPFNSNISAIIDNPNDIDYYKITVSQPTIIQYSISSSNNYSLLYAAKEGSNSGIYMVNSNKKSYKIMPGSYYFAVLSENGKYSSTNEYTINFNKIGTMTSDSEATVIGISEEAGIVYQTNYTGTVNYINGNKIDISYSYYENLSNSAGTQLYDISLDSTATVSTVQSGALEPAAVYYLNSTRPALNVSNQPALLLTYTSGSNFYKVHCRGTGAYSMNTFWQDMNIVTVLIDPATGKLIDISEFNYFYDFAPVGSNSITWTRSFNMQFYNN